MNRKTLYLNALAATLLGTGAAQAASLDDAIRAQTRAASAAIQEEARTGLHAQFVLDVPGVEIGDIKLVDRDARPVERPAASRPQALLETTENGISEALYRDLAVKALTAPGMFGVYRHLSGHLSGYMTASALKVAIIVAE